MVERVIEKYLTSFYLTINFFNEIREEDINLNLIYKNNMRSKKYFQLLINNIIKTYILLYFPASNPLTP